MKKPQRRPDLPHRASNNDKRRLLTAVEPALIAQLVATVTYEGSSKHKRNPHAFGLPPYNGRRGHETLCDAHAGFTPAQMTTIPALITRGLNAGLIGTGHMIWTVGDNGWISRRGKPTWTNHNITDIRSKLGANCRARVYAILGVGHCGRSAGRPNSCIKLQGAI